MHLNAAISSDFAPTVDGIIACLRMLVDEASALKLKSTLTALRETIAACEAENARAGLDIASPVARTLH